MDHSWISTSLELVVFVCTRHSLAISQAWKVALVTNDCATIMTCVHFIFEQNPLAGQPRMSLDRTNST